MTIRRLSLTVFFLTLLTALPASAYLLRLTGVTTEWSLVLPNARVEDVNIAVVETGVAALLCYERFPEPGVRTVQAQAATGGALCCVGLMFKEEKGSLWVKKAYAGYVSGNVPGSYDFDQGGYTVMTTHSSAYYNVKSVDLRTKDPKPGRPDVTLPDGAEELQYIESSGTQYLDSGVNAANGLYACADATLLEGNYTVGLFGILRHLGMYLYQGSTLYCYHKGGTMSVRNIDPGYRHLYTASNAVYRVDNVLIGSVAEPDFAGTSMYVFAMRNESGSGVFDGKAKMRLYGFVVRSTATGETLCDLVPCKDPSGVVCCYDAVAKEFRYNQGTGDFTPGPGMNFMNVEGSPNVYGKPDPDYGTRDGLMSGTSYTFTAPAAFSNAVGHTRYTCLGWKVVKADGTESAVTAANVATIPYSSEYAASSLVWLWKIEHKVTAQACGVGGTVTPAEQWVEEGGETTVTAAVVSGAGSEFIKWRGDGVTAENETSETIDIVVDNPMTLAADFGVPGALMPSGGDDTAQIAAAIAALGEAGGVVHLGPGTFSLTQQLSNAVPVRIVGSGSAFTTIVSSGTTQPQRTVYLNHPQATVEKCTLMGRSSSAGLHGMVVLVDRLGGRVEDCVVTGAHAGANAYGALYLAGSSSFADRCVVTGNSGGVNTGGLEVDGGHAANCLICGNDDLFAQAYRAGGVYVAGGGTVSNCTVTANTGVNIGGIWVKDGTVVNTISCGNAVGLTCDNGYSGTADRHGAETSFVNCLFEDPGFIDAANGDYRLIPRSAAIDASVGDEIFAAATDLVGNPRRVRRADLGCYEQPGDQDQLWITGEPEEYAATEVTPGYGVVNGLADGSVFPCTAPAEIDDGGTAATCTGWELYGQNAETYEWTLLRRSTNENKLQCDFAYPETPMRTKLVWKWAALLKAEATATAGGSASVDRSAYAFGDTVTAVATPASDAVVFSRWTGDVPTGRERENPLVFPADRPCALVAHFVAKRTYVKPATDTAATPSAPYATPETATTDVFGVMDSGDLVDGCEIVFLDGEHSIDRQLEAAAAALVIRSENGAAKTTVRCTTSGKRVILLDNANAVVRGLTLVGNANGPDGTVVMVDKRGGRVEDCVLTGASSRSSGALYLTGSSAFADRCVITGNSGALYTSAVYMNGGHAANCLVYRNSSHPDPGTMRPGGIYLAGGGTVSNCTVTANTGINVGGIRIVNSGTVVNTISHGNIQGGRYGDYAGSVEWNGTAANFVNCLFEDPKFIDAENGDYRPRACSAAIDASVGDEIFAAATDLVGNPRRVRRADLGCYEQQGDQDQLWITGEPEEYAATEVTPGYGVVNGLADGSAFPCTAPAEIDDGGTAATCTGWELYGQNAETYEWTLLRRSTNENKLQCDFAYPETPMRTKLVWKWSARLKVEAAATAGGSASVDQSSYAFGDTVTAVATPASDAVVFSRWTGDVPTGMERENPLVFPADRPRALVARFVAKRTYVKPATDTAATPSAPYATPETATTDVFDAVDGGDLVDGCELVFLDGEHALDRQLEAVDAALVIRSENGAAKTTVRCAASGGRVIRLDNANAVVRGLKLVGNENGPDGTVVMVDQHGGRVEDCVLTGASSRASGALYLTSSAAFADRCVITGNSGAILTSALYVKGGHAANCLIYGNSSHPDPGQLRVGGIYLTGGGTVSNCTVTANTGINVGGIQISNSGTVVNTISYGNIQGGTFGDYTGSVEWTGAAASYVSCLFEDPHFRNAAAHDYTLRPGSPAINAGVNSCWGADAVDLSGNARVFNFGKRSGLVDLGCYESPYGTPGFMLIVR